jgi:hypothetical protein
MHCVDVSCSGLAGRIVSAPVWDREWTIVVFASMPAPDNRLTTLTRRRPAPPPKSSRSSRRSGALGASLPVTLRPR